MISRKIVAAGVAAAAVCAGAAGAIAATATNERKKAEAAVLSDAAKRLAVTPSELRDALAKAQDAQLDAAVKDGRLTQAQADAMKKRRSESGTVLGMPGGPGHRGGPGGPHGPRGLGGPGGFAEAAATALGLERDELFEQLRDGKTLADVAKAQGKSLSAVKAAVKKSVTAKLAEGVKDGRLTDAQRDAILERFDGHFDRFASGKGPFGRGKGGRGFGHPGHGGPLPAMPGAGAQNENGSSLAPLAPQVDAS